MRVKRKKDELIHFLSEILTRITINSVTKKEKDEELERDLERIQKLVSDNEEVSADLDYLLNFYDRKDVVGFNVNLTEYIIRYCNEKEEEEK